MNLRSILLSFVLGTLFAFLPIPVQAEVSIVVSGQTELSAKGPVSLSIDEFEDLAPRTIIKTTSPWHPLSTFSGISGKDFLNIVGAYGHELALTALNDYQVKIPLSDLTDRGVLFVTRLNGKRLSLRQKGPLFLIYPFDQNPQLKSEKYYGRSIWQVKEISVR